MKHRAVSVVVLIVLLCTFISPIQATQAQNGLAKWTLMIYIAANNDLEPASIVNLMEMAAVGSTADVNIVVQITRPPDYKGFYGEWGGTRRFLITQSDGGLSSGDFQISTTRVAEYVTTVAPQLGLTEAQVDSVTKGSVDAQESAALQLTIPVIDPETPLSSLDLESVEDLGTEVNSGDAATLADFGTWTVENYPAEHYGLVLWDHGGGWTMIASDDTLGPTGMSMPALQTALETITQATGQKLDFIGFDACLMAQLAVSVTVQPYAAYLIASEELVPGMGWNYLPPLRALVENPELTVPELASIQIDAFDTLYSTTAKRAASSYDAGVIDLAQMDGVVQALDAFVSAVKASPSNELKAISTARGNVQEFSSLGQDSAATAAFSSVDLSDFMRLMVNLSSEAEVKQAASNVIEAVSQAVLYHKASKTLPNARGLSIYFPANADIFVKAGGERYRQEFGAMLPGWQEFLDTVYGKAAATSELALEISAVSTTETEPGSIYNSPVITYSLNGSNIVGVNAQILYQLDENTNVILSSFQIDSGVTTEDGSTINDYPDGQSINDFYWNAKIPSISDGINNTLVLMTTNDKDAQHGYISGVYTNRRTGKQANASLLIDLDTYQAGNVWVAQATSATTQSVAQVTPSAGDTFEPTFVTLDANGSNEQTVSSGAVLTFGKEPFQVMDTPSPDGTYVVVLTATDAAGTDVAAVTMITVQNNGLDPQWQGFKDLNFGLSFLYPGTWTAASVFERADGTNELYMGDLAGEFYLSAVDYTDVTSLEEITAKMQDEINGIEGVQADAPFDVQVGDEPGVAVSYQYTDANGVVQMGIAVAVYSAETQQSYVLKIEAPSDRAEEAQLVIQQVLASSQFFQPAQ